MRNRFYFLAMAGGFGIAGCAPWSMSPMEVGVFRGDGREPVADAKVSVHTPVIGVWLRRTEWSSLTSSGGIAEFPGVPDSRGLQIDIEADGVTLVSRWSASHPKEADCHTIQTVAGPVGANQLYIELRCKPKPE